jgi:hypothetical protein
MSNLLARTGQLAGLLGILLMAVAVAARLTGRYALGDFQIGTLLLASIGGLAVGCFLMLWSIADRTRR